MRNRESSWWRAREKLRSSNAERTDSKEGDQGGLVPLRDELLPALPASGTHGPFRGHRHLPHWFPVHRSARSQPALRIVRETQIDIAICEKPAQHRSFRETIKSESRSLLQEFQVIRRVMKHPNVPWYAKLVAGCSVCYVFSSVQFLPNFIPVVGQLDDVLVVTLGLKLLKNGSCPTSSQSAAPKMFRGRPCKAVYEVRAFSGSSAAVTPASYHSAL